MYPALFALYPSYEKTRGVRALQYSNGVRTFPLWCAHLLFDFCFIIISSTISTIIIARQAPGWFEVGFLFPILLLYGLSGTGFGYVISVFASSQLATFAFAAGIQGVMFILSILAFSVKYPPLFVFSRADEASSPRVLATHRTCNCLSTPPLLRSIYFSRLET